MILKAKCMIDNFKTFKNFYSIHNGFISNFIDKPAENSNSKITGSVGSSLKLVNSPSNIFSKRTLTENSFTELGQNKINIVVDQHRAFINVKISIDSNSVDDLKILAKFTIEDKLEEIMKKEDLFMLESRRLIVFSILVKSDNVISQMILEGIKSIIQILSCKNIYTNLDIITVKYDKEITEIILDETYEFLLSPGISKVIHSSMIEFKKKPEQQSRSKEQRSFILVTGGARGIGEATSRTLAQEGHNVIMTGRKSNLTVDEFAKNIQKEFNVETKFLELDIGDPKSIQHFVKYLKENQIYLNSVVHNAGVGSYTSKEQSNTLKDANDVLIEVNSIGTVLLQEELEKSGMLL